MLDTVSTYTNVSLSPVKIDEAVYGNTNIQFKNFLAPGMFFFLFNYELL